MTVFDNASNQWSIEDNIVIPDGVALTCQDPNMAIVLTAYRGYYIPRLHCTLYAVSRYLRQEANLLEHDSIC